MQFVLEVCLRTRFAATLQPVSHFNPLFCVWQLDTSWIYTTASWSLQRLFCLPPEVLPFIMSFHCFTNDPLPPTKFPLKMWKSDFLQGLWEVGRPSDLCKQCWHYETLSAICNKSSLASGVSLQLYSQNLSFLSFLPTLKPISYRTPIELHCGHKACSKDKKIETEKTFKTEKKTSFEREKNWFETNTLPHTCGVKLVS